MRQIQNSNVTGRETKTMRNCSQVIILCGVFTWQIVDNTIIDMKIFIGAALMFGIVAIFLFSSTTSCTSLADSRFKIESAQSMSILEQNRRHCSGWVWSGATPRYWKPRVILQGFHIFCVALWRRIGNIPVNLLQCWNTQRFLKTYHVESHRGSEVSEGLLCDTG